MDGEELGHNWPCQAPSVKIWKYPGLIPQPIVSEGAGVENGLVWYKVALPVLLALTGSLIDGWNIHNYVYIYICIYIYTVGEL
jgi:hypothetical protein